MNTDSRQAADLPPVSDDVGSSDLTLRSSADVTRRLNYFDGRFLRAEDLNQERRAQRDYVDYSNRAGGWGVVYGLDFSVNGASFDLGDGLAIDRMGRVLLLDRPHKRAVAALIASASDAGTPGPQQPAAKVNQPTTSAGGSGFEPCATEMTTAETPGTGLYVVMVERTEVFEGKEDVFGRLCDTGCASASDSRSVVDAVTVRAVRLGPLVLPSLKGVTNAAHERSQVASAYFDQEQQAASSLLSPTGLSLPTWCKGATADAADNGVALAVIKWDGSSVKWHDGWTVRRERMEPPTHRYWAGRVEMRPWSVFMAQLLQFQCQLAELGTSVASSLATRGIVSSQQQPIAPPDTSLDWIDDLSSAVPLIQDTADTEAARRITQGIDRLRELQARVAALDSTNALLATSDRIFLDVGLVTLPAAGYTRTQSTSAAGLRRELELLFGPGVDLHLCATRRDQIPHELERATHMDRISLIQGLADSSAREQVDVLVPDGVVEDSTRALESHGFAVDLSIGPSAPSTPGPLGVAAAASTQNLAMKGAARLDASTGLTARMAVAGTDAGSLGSVVRPLADLMRGRSTFAKTASALGKLNLGTDRLSLAALREVAQSTVAQGSQLRAADKATGFVRVPHAEGRVAAISASLWTARDPFSMADGDSTGFHAEWDTTMPQAATFGVSIVADGRVQRVSAAPTAGGLVVTVQVNGVAVISGTGVKPAEATQSFARTLTLTRSSDGTRDEIVVKDVESRLEAAVRWSGRPIEAVGDVGVDSVGQSSARETVARFEAAESGAIYQAGNEYRDAAIAAIQILSALRPDDRLYVERVFEELFPEATSASLSLVRPVHSWVLFRRRRREECEGAAAFPVQGTSKVAAWMVRAAGVKQAEEYRVALMDPGETRIPWTSTPVEMVLFETRTATLRSSSARWRERYQAAGGGSGIWFAGYAKAVSSTDPPIGLARARTLVNATAPLATMVQGDRVDLVPSPPAGQMVSDTEGSIFLITYPIAEGITVVAVDGVNEKFKNLLAAVKNGDPDGLQERPAEALTQLASSNMLDELSDDDIAAALTRLAELSAAISDAGDVIVRDAYLWISSAVGAGRLAQIKGRLDEIVRAFGFDPEKAHRLTVDFEPEQVESVRLYITLERVVLN